MLGRTFVRRAEESSTSPKKKTKRENWESLVAQKGGAAVKKRPSRFPFLKEFFCLSVLEEKRAWVGKKKSPNSLGSTTTSSGDTFTLSRGKGRGEKRGVGKTKETLESKKGTSFAGVRPLDDSFKEVLLERARKEGPVGRGPRCPPREVKGIRHSSQEKGRAIAGEGLCGPCLLEKKAARELYVLERVNDRKEKGEGAGLSSRKDKKSGAFDRPLDGKRELIRTRGEEKSKKKKKKFREKKPTWSGDPLRSKRRGG